MSGPPLQTDDVIMRDRGEEPGDERDAPSWISLIPEQWRIAEDELENVQQNRLRDKYDPVIDALRERGYDREALYFSLTPGQVNEMAGQGEYNRPAIWKYIELERRKAKEAGQGDPFPDLPKTRKEFERPELTRFGDRQRDQKEVSRGTFGGQLASGLVGTGALELTRPINLATLPAGGFGGTIARRVLTEGLVQGGIATIGLPEIAAGRDALGEETGAEQVAMHIGGAALGGAVIRGGIETVGPGVKAASQKFDPNWSDKQLAKAFRDSIPENQITPEQQAALIILERQAEIENVNPFASTIDGLDAHGARLDAALKEISEGRAVSATALREADETVDAPVPLSRPSANAPASGGVNIAAVKRAIGGAESGNTDQVTNGMGGSASGRYQIIRSTFIAYYRRVFGSSEAAAQKAWQTQRFDRNVQERLMDRMLQDNTQVLSRAGVQVDTGNLYLAHFLGGQKAAQVLRMDPATPVSQVFSAEVIRMNPGYMGGGKTVGQMIDAVRAKVGSGAASGDGGAARTGNPVPVRDGGAVIKAVFGDGVTITQTRRDPNSALGRANPNSWHNRTGAAVDMAAIPGMTFRQAKAAIEARGYTLIEAIDEYANPSPHATGGHWHFVIAEGGGGAPVRTEPTGPAPRPAALDAERPSVYINETRVPLMSFSSREIDVDAELMQFKSGGDEFGVTDRLRGVEEWDPFFAKIVTVWEALDGRRLIADGHQRLGLAKRISAKTGEEIRLNAFVLREADGFTASDARLQTAVANITEGSGATTDAARIFRELIDDPDVEAQIMARISITEGKVKDARGLARLSQEAFGAVVNDVIPENYGAAIGRLVDDPELHPAMVQVLADTNPPNRLQAEAIIRQAMDAGFVREVQDSLFGSEVSMTGLFAARAKLLDKALGELKKMKGAFGVAVRNSETLEAGGNRIDVAGSKAEVEANALALALVNRLALRKGNVVNEALTRSAERIAAGERPADVLRDFIGEIRKLDLDDIARAGDDADGSGAGLDGSGRAVDDPGEVDAGPGLFDDDLTPAQRDAQAAERPFNDHTDLPPEPDPRFAEPDSEGIRETTESLWHDIRVSEDGQADFAAPTPQQTRTALERSTEGGIRPTGETRAPGEDGGLFDTRAPDETLDLGDGSSPRTIAQIRADLDAEKSAIETMRNCLK